MMNREQIVEWIRDNARWEFARSGGPGGQNVNKVSTKVTLRLPVDELPVPERDRERLLRVLDSRITAGNELLVHSSESRSQAKNREQAVLRAAGLIHHALLRPKPRRKTRKPRSAHERRLAQKKRRGEVKRQRRDPGVP